MARYRPALFVLLLLLGQSLALVSAVAPSSAHEPIKLIRVVMDDNYPPFTFKDSQGNQQGILIDQWRLWERKTGIEVQISAMDWGSAIARMKAGEFDVIDTVFQTEERSTWLDFSGPYAKIEVPIFFDKNISGIGTAASLKGFAVGVKSGDATNDILKQNGIDTLVLFNSYEAIIRAAKEHKVNVFVVDKPPAMYFLYKYGIADRYQISPPLNFGELHRAVRKGNAALLLQVDDGFRLIPADDLRKIETKWHGSSPYRGLPLLPILIIAGSAVLLLLIFYLWNSTLRKKVETKTAELKSSLEALQANAAFITTLVNAIPIPIFYKDKQGCYLGFNTSFEELHGLTREEMIGKCDSDLAAGGSSRDLELEILQSSGRRVLETQLRDARGVVRDVVFHLASYTDGDGNVSGLIGAILDITEHKKATRSLSQNEARLRTLVHTIPDLVWVKDADGIYLSCNPMFERFFGAKEADIVGKTDYDFVDKELADFFRQHDRIAMEAGKPSSNEEWVTFATDGHRALLNTIKTPMCDAGGNLIGVLGIARDITELKNAETERLDLERQLLHSQKLESLGVLSGGIAHDFNNLLQAILGHLDLALRRLPRDESTGKNITHAVNAAKQAAKLTNMMLAYSGKGSFIIRELNLTELVEENAEMLSAAISKSIKLDLQLDHGLPPVMADAGQLQQVVMNLITNASEALGNESGTVTLATGVRKFDRITLNDSRLQEKLPGGTYVWLEVSDDGCGMDQETLQKLFDPFFTTKFTGRGLGMSAVLGIVRAHKGAFLVKSNPGVGTTILVVLPIAHPAHGVETAIETANETAGRPPGSAGGSAVTSKWHHPGVVLVVDDEEIIRGVCVDMMEDLGFETLVASNGEEALALFRQHREEIGLVLLDQSMPGMDGIGTLQALKRIDPGVKVLLASGYSKEEISLRTRGMGLNGFIQKPFILSNLSAEMQRVLDLP